MWSRQVNINMTNNYLIVSLCSDCSVQYVCGVCMHAFVYVSVSRISGEVPLYPNCHGTDPLG